MRNQLNGLYLNLPLADFGKAYVAGIMEGKRHGIDGAGEASFQGKIIGFQAGLALARVCEIEESSAKRAEWWERVFATFIGSATAYTLFGIISFIVLSITHL